MTFEFDAEMLKGTKWLLSQSNQDQGILTKVNPTFTRFSAIFILHSLSPNVRPYLSEYKTVFPFSLLEVWVPPYNYTK